MKCKWIGWLALAMLCSNGYVQAGAIENLFGTWWKKEVVKPAMVKVLIVHDQPGVVVEVKGKYRVFDPHTNAFFSTRFIGKRRFVQPMTDGLKWGEEFPGVHQITIVPDDSKTTTLVEGVEYKGDIYVYDIGGSISIVNEVPLEDYLKTLLIPQHDRRLADEAAAAVAIAARTNTWYQVQNSGNQFWSVEASKVGYQGHAATIQDTSFDNAIAETRNMIMLKDGAPFPAVWSNDRGQSAGQSARISLSDAEDLAKKGEHAAQILSKAFPGSTLTTLQ